MIVIESSTLAALWRDLSAGHLTRTIAQTLEEDGAQRDITTRFLCDSPQIRAGRIVARQPGVCSGMGLLDGFLQGRELRGSLEEGIADGVRVAEGTTLIHLRGSLTNILPIERSLLNLLSIAMATATVTSRYVDAVAGTRARVCDTRKTIPGLRWLQKYAVACGGGELHRMGLDDAVLVKDNHIAGLSPTEYARRIQEAVPRMRAAGTPLRFVCVEADTIEQFEALLALPANTVDIALLDNFSVDLLARAVEMRGKTNPTMLLEASGGVRLETIAAIARTGVDRISVGALTHGAGSIDLALDMD
ncbi:MAG: carboxylating nicotinate-nucleotide diphosphorylase [Phycisphaerales bacterium]|nr:carboxylating nicotinate-nucleotide diphosphorylase [Phycisphaerales bacterium]